MKFFVRSAFGSLLALAVSSCAAAPIKKKEVAPASAAIHKEFLAARAAYDKKDRKTATLRLRKFVTAHPNTELTDTAHYLLGRLYADAGQYQEAVKSFSDAVTETTKPAIEDDSEIREAAAASHLGQVDKARALLAQVAKSSHLTPERKVFLAEVSLDISAQLQDRGEQLKNLSYLSENYPVEAKRQQYKAQALELLSKMSPEDLKKNRNDENFSAFRPEMKFRYGEALMAEHQFGDAHNEFSEVVALAPGSTWAEQAQQSISELDSTQKVNPRVIGAILPLSGPLAGHQSAIAYRALHGLELGLGVYGKNQSNFQLAVIDSEGSPEMGRRAVEKLVAEDNVIAIVGGLSSRTAAAEAQRAQELGVPFIALSQKSGLTQIGNFIFRNALTSQMQVQYLVDVAMSAYKMSRFAILYPNDAYGVEYANLFWDEVRERGGQIVGAQTYDSKETDFRGPVQRLTGRFYLDDRADELRLQTKALQEKDEKVSARAAAPKPEDLLTPIVDFDAIFIPDSTRALGQIAPMLAYNDVDNIRLLGTNLWNTSDVIQRGQKYVEQAVFVDSFLANSPTFTNSDFFANFKATFGDDPASFEAQGYDSALALRQIISSGETSRLGLAESLSKLNRFSGALGPVAMSSDREIRRPMVGLTVHAGQIVPLGSIAQ
jgi:ABC-type branched-subunit amino acid transport system substrate-binding protein